MTIKTKPLLLLLSSALFLTACTTQPTNTGQTPSTTPTPTVAREQSLSTSLRELIAKGGSLQCKYKYTDPDSKVETKGTMYLSGSNFAQDVEIPDPSKKTSLNTKMSMISDGSTMYTWNPDKKDTGMKLPVDKTTVDKTQSNNTSVDLDKKMDMNCSPWTSDQSRFNVPTDVKFTDLSELMKSVPAIPKNIPTIPGQK